VASVSPENAARALAHSLRATILDALGKATRSPNELAEELGEPLGNVSYHVTTLRGLGLIELVDTTPRRGALEHYYRALVRVRVQIDPVA
jgi:DNA-binding transcriptional ArsR family regulator